MRRDGPPDKRLFRRARHGDRQAFVVLLRRYDPRLRRLVLRLVAEPSRIDVVLNRAYLRAWRSLPHVEPPESVAEWLYRIVYNACVNEVRWAPAKPMSGPPEGPWVPLPLASPTRRLAGLRALDPEDRVALVLVDGEGFTLEAAANILKRPDLDVASDVMRARQLWRRLVVGDPEPRTVRPTVELEPSAVEVEAAAAEEAAAVEAAAATNGDRRGHVKVVDAATAAAAELPKPRPAPAVRNAPKPTPPPAPVPEPTPEPQAPEAPAADLSEAPAPTAAKPRRWPFARKPKPEPAAGAEAPTADVPEAPPAEADAAPAPEDEVVVATDASPAEAEAAPEPVAPEPAASEDDAGPEAPATEAVTDDAPDEEPAPDEPAAAEVPPDPDPVAETPEPAAEAEPAAEPETADTPAEADEPAEPETVEPVAPAGSNGRSAKPVASRPRRSRAKPAADDQSEEVLAAAPVAPAEPSGEKDENGAEEAPRRPLHTGEVFIVSVPAPPEATDVSEAAAEVDPGSSGAPPAEDESSADRRRTSSGGSAGARRKRRRDVKRDPRTRGRSDHAGDGQSRGDGPRETS